MNKYQRNIVGTILLRHDKEDVPDPSCPDSVKDVWPIDEWLYYHVENRYTTKLITDKFPECYDATH